MIFGCECCVAIPLVPLADLSEIQEGESDETAEVGGGKEGSCRAACVRFQTEWVISVFGLTNAMWPTQNSGCLLTLPYAQHCSSAPLSSSYRYQLYQLQLTEQARARSGHDGLPLRQMYVLGCCEAQRTQP